MYMRTRNRYSLATFLIETESRNTSVDCKKKHGGDGKRWPFTPLLFPPHRPPAIKTPSRPVPAGPPIS